MKIEDRLRRIFTGRLPRRSHVEGLINELITQCNIEFLKEWKEEVPKCECKYVCECQASIDFHERVDIKLKQLEGST